MATPALLELNSWVIYSFEKFPEKNPERVWIGILSLNNT
jgi:hypothetical protein